MKKIELNASQWTDVDDFYDALLGALEAPDWHGHNMNALVDSMIWGGINAVEPPYKIQIVSSRYASGPVMQEIDLAKFALQKARMDFRSTKGQDREVDFEILS